MDAPRIRSLAVATAAAIVVVGIVQALLGGGRTDGPPLPGANGATRGAVVWAVGDSADGGEGAARVAELIIAGEPDALLYLGDVYENGTAEEYRDYYEPVYGPLKEITFPTPGNHEWPEREQGYNPYWADRLGEPTPPWYRGEIAGWEVLSLNSEQDYGPGTGQLRWLRQQLRGGGDCRIAIFHRPRFTASTERGDAEDLDALWNLLAGRVTLVLNGHDHTMQRLKPIDGVTTLISGAGGHSRYGLNYEDPRLAFGDDQHDGALELELAPGRARYRFVTVDGEVLDTGSSRCSE